MKNISGILAEDTPLKPVSADLKQGWLFLASVLIGGIICVPIFFMGAQISQTLPYTHFVFATMIGGLLATAIAIATGYVGQRTGLPTAMLNKIAFGSRGCIIVNAAMAITAIGWFGIQTSIFSNAFISLSDQVWGVTFSPVLVTIIAGCLMSTTAIIGFRGLGKLSYLSVPLLIVLLFVPVVDFYQSGKFSILPGYVPKNPTFTVGIVIAIVAGAYSFTTTMPDLTRFLKTPRAMAGGMMANLLYPGLLILTGSAAIAAGENDYMQIMLNIGLGGFAVLVLFLATWTTNDTNIYASTLAINPFIPKFSRWKIAAIAGVGGTIFAVSGIFEHFMSWLIFTGNLFAPMAGVYVSDYWLNRKRYESPDYSASLRWPQLISWLGGLGVGLCTTGRDNMGLDLLSLTTVPMLDALLVAAVLQVVLQKIHAKKNPAFAG